MFSPSGKVEKLRHVAVGKRHVGGGLLMVGLVEVGGPLHDSSLHR